MPIEIPLIYLLTEPCSGACFFFFSFFSFFFFHSHLLFISSIPNKLQATVDRLWWVFHWLLTFPPPFHPKEFLITSHNSPCMSVWNKSFFGCLEQNFLEGIVKPYEGTILTTGKVCCFQYLLVFRLIYTGLHGWKTDPGLETERLDIASFVVGSCWPP